MLRRTIAPLAVLLVVAACNDNETPPPAHGPYVGAAPAALPSDPFETYRRGGADRH
jgi:hypothetical protein